MKKENIIPLLALFLSIFKDIFMLFIIALFVIAGKLFMYIMRLGRLVVPRSIYKGRGGA